MGIKIGSDEPLWIVNYKKSIASQLQLDITDVRRGADGLSVNWSPPKNDESETFTASSSEVKFCQNWAMNLLHNCISLSSTVLDNG